MTEPLLLEPVLLEIERLGAQGDGIGRAIGGAGPPVYVPFTLPEETVRAVIDGDRARLADVITASPQRVAPVCRHFGICGGCALQHMEPAAYLDWKRGLISAAFAAAKLDTPNLTIERPQGGRRRAVFGARSGPGYDSGRGTALGFHRAGSHDLVDIAECPVLVPGLAAALPALRRLAGLVAPPDTGFRVIVLETKSGLDVAVQGAAKRLQPDVTQRLAQVMSSAGIARLSLDGDVVLSRVAPAIQCGPAAVSPPPGVFVQAVEAAEMRLAGLVVAAAGRSKMIADLFCGLGAFTLPLARGAKVTAADNDRTAIDALITAAKATPGIKQIEARTRDLYREPLSARELDAFDCVVFDPPRAGAEAQARALAKSKVPIVVAVSCNPQTLARDVRILVDSGYAIEQVTAVDQFHYTAHVEAVTVLKRQSARPANRRST